MRNTLKISALAMAAAMLALPASAASVNLGNGQPLVDLGSNSDGSDAAVNLNLGGAGSGTNLLGGSGGTNAVVNADLANSADPNVTVDLGNTLGNGGTGATVDLGGTGTTGNGLQLFGTNEPTVASLNLGGNDGTDADVLLDLFGSPAGGGATTADLTLDNGGTGVLGDLFGPSGDSGAGGSGAGGSTTGDDLFGPASGSGSGGSARGSGLLPVRVAALGDSGANCFIPDAGQIGRLVNRHSYSAATFSSWAGVGHIKVVDVNLCDSAGAKIAGQANVGRLQAFVSANPALRAGLQRAGHSPDDVIAIDRSGETLTVYVM